jgi:hypothetical protein
MSTILPPIRFLDSDSVWKTLLQDIEALTYDIRGLKAVARESKTADSGPLRTWDSRWTDWKASYCQHDEEERAIKPRIWDLEDPEETHKRAMLKKKIGGLIIACDMEREECRQHLETQRRTRSSSAKYESFVVPYHKVTRSFGYRY